MSAWYVPAAMFGQVIADCRCQVFFGVSYSLFACALWPMAGRLVAQEHTGTAYGIMQSLQVRRCSSLCLVRLSDVCCVLEPWPRDRPIDCRSTAGSRQDELFCNAFLHRLVRLPHSHSEQVGLMIDVQRGSRYCVRSAAYYCGPCPRARADGCQAAVLQVLRGPCRDRMSRRTHTLCVRRMLFS